MLKSILSNLFPGETPINLIIEHSRKLEAVSKELEKLVNSYFQGEDISNLVEYISKVESEADDIKFALRALLRKDIKVRFSKKDLTLCMHLQDAIIDMIEDIAKKMTINDISDIMDDYARENFIRLVKLVVESVDYLEDAIHELKYVVGSSFAEIEQEKEEKEILKVERLESSIDSLTLELGKWVYSRKNEINPVDLFFFNDLVMIFSKIGDYAENLAELVRNFTR